MNETEKIYKVKAKPNRDGAWWVFGLNLLGENKLTGIDNLIPFKVWLQCLLDDGSLSILMGGSAVDSEGWPDLAVLRPTVVRTTFYAGRIYDGSQNVIPGVFCPRVTTDFLVSELMDKYFHYDGLGILGGVQHTDRMIDVLNSFTSEEDTLERLRELSQWVIISQGDAQYLEVWSSRPAAEADIQRCSEAADLKVRELQWFHEAMSALHWSDDRLCCVLGDT